MKVFISVDMEGISGVVAPKHTERGNADYERFRKLMTQEANAAIEGALDGGASQIIVNDSHGLATNLLIEELNPAAELISGQPKPLIMMQGIGTDFDTAFFIGYHSGSGRRSGILAHTMTANVAELRLNGQLMGEIGFNAAVAGAFGVPVKLVTGDSAVTNEAKELLGNVETVIVKEGLSAAAAQCIHPRATHDLIRQAAKRALKIDVNPFVIEPPITLNLVFKHPIHADLTSMMPGIQRISGSTVEWTGEDMHSIAGVFFTMLMVTMAENLLK